MHTIENLLDMIRTEAAGEEIGTSASEVRTAKPASFRSNLELVKEPDGSLVWVED